MESLDESLNEAVCVDEEVFFGPITEKERKIREQFENLHRNELNGVEVSKIVEDDESQNHSVYKSFSVEDSKYDSFDDSLNEGTDKMPQETKLITVKKSYDKVKYKISGFYDSLEDVCSLVSNIDKCSISCEVENESNLNSKLFVEDSLKVTSVPAASKNNFISDQLHFDDDSLAILECETTFSDSLDEINVLENIEIEDIHGIDNISVENKNAVLTVDQCSVYPPKNLFDTSVEIACEKKKVYDNDDQAESFNDKNLLYDSLSNSDFKDIFSDSLEEVKHLKEMLSSSKHSIVNIICDKESVTSSTNNELFNIEQNYGPPLPNIFDTSAHIVSEKHEYNNIGNPMESSNDKSIIYDSLSNSEVKDVSKDSLEQSVKSNDILNISQQTIDDNITKLPDLFDTSVFIVSEKYKENNITNPKESSNDKSIIYDSLPNSEVKDISKDSLEDSVNSSEILNISQQTIDDNMTKLPNLFDASVLIVSEKHKDYNIPNRKESSNDKSIIYDSLSNSGVNDVSKDSLEFKSNEILNISQQTIDDNVTKLPNLFDASVLIVSEKHKDNNIPNPKESSNDKSIIYDSLSNSGVKDVSKDSLDESVKSNGILNISQQTIADNITKSDVFPKQIALDTSVQIIYDNSSNSFERKNNYEKNDKSKGNLENFKQFQEISEQAKIESNSEQFSALKSVCSSLNLSENFKSMNANKNVLHSDAHINVNNDIKPETSAVTKVSDSLISPSVNDISNIKKETFSVESCHLKILNEHINIDENLKFQLHIEVTVGDKKCQIAPQDITIVPVNSDNYKPGDDSNSNVPVAIPSSSSISNTKNEHIRNFNNPEVNLESKKNNVFRTHSPSEINTISHNKSQTSFTSNITQRIKSPKTLCTDVSCMDSFNDVGLLQALDLQDISAPFFNESIIQSKDSLIPLNLYSLDEYVQNFHEPQFKNKNKENIPEHRQALENEKKIIKGKNVTPNKMYNCKTPQSLLKCPSFKEANKKTPCTKIPVRKPDNFVVPAPTPSKSTKQLPATMSAEKLKKCQHSPHSIDSGKKTPGTTSNKAPHICKVRNTIFSKVPQIIPSKKYMNVQSPVAQYIKNNSGPVKTPGIDPVLQDCMNRLMESPHHLHHTHGSGPLKSSKKKA